jgi:hypothetical protein
MFASNDDLLNVEAIGRQNIYSVLQFISYKMEKQEKINKAHEKAVG